MAWWPFHSFRYMYVCIYLFLIGYDIAVFYVRMGSNDPVSRCGIINTSRRPRLETLECNAANLFPQVEKYCMRDDPPGEIPPRHASLSKWRYHMVVPNIYLQTDRGDIAAALKLFTSDHENCVGPGRTSNSTSTSFLHFPPYSICNSYSITSSSTHSEK